MPNTNKRVFFCAALSLLLLFSKDVYSKTEFSGYFKTTEPKLTEKVKKFFQDLFSKKQEIANPYIRRAD